MFPLVSWIPLASHETTTSSPIDILSARQSDHSFRSLTPSSSRPGRGLPTRSILALPPTSTQVSSRVVRGTTAISQTNFQAQKPDWLSISRCRAHQRRAPARSRNVRLRVYLDCWHRDSRRRGGARQRARARDDPARCKFRSAPQSKPLSAFGDNSSECRRRDFLARPRRVCASSISGSR